MNSRALPCRRPEAAAEPANAYFDFFLLRSGTSVVMPGLGVTGGRAGESFFGFFASFVLRC